MPINVIDGEIYNINYDEILDEALSKRVHLFDNRELEVYYYKYWINALKDTDRKLSKSYLQGKYKKILDKELTEEAEIFQKEILFPNTKVYIYFRISPLRDILKRSENINRYVTLPISDFCNKESDIIWSKIDNMNTLITPDNPIILCLFFSKDKNYLAIDGNHRITQAVNKNYPEIKAYIIPDKTMVEYNFFATKFDKLYYIFNNEIVHLYTLKVDNRLPDDKLIKYSYMYKGIFNF